MKYPRRCMVCDSFLLKYGLTGHKELTECRNCRTRYNKVFLKECDPEYYERARLSKNTDHVLFYWDEETRVLRFPTGLGLNPRREKLKNAT